MTPRGSDDEPEHDPLPAADSAVELRQQQALARLLGEAKCAVALTGAGISVPSGIPDFRSAGGLWETEDPMKVASKTGFINNPAAFWDFYRRRWASLQGFEPNDAHRVLAQLESQGLLAGIVTQNIDGLHQKAGSQRVHEMHGSIRQAICAVCQAPVAWSELDSLPRAADGHYECPTGCGNPVKPDLILFGEQLHEPDWTQARQLVKKECDLLIIIGTSMTVEPVASLPKKLAHHPRKRIVIVNQAPTPWDRKASAILGGDCAQAMRSVMSHLAR